MIGGCGWRIGFVYAPPAVISGMLTLQQHLITCAGSFAQAGAATALSGEVDPGVRALWAEWERRCAFMVDADVASVVPVRHVDDVLAQKRPDGRGQHGGEMTRDWRNHDYQ